MYSSRTRGFTLMELLVVIAIIGILASVVLASLNTARNKGADAAVKSNLNNTRAQSALYFDGNGNSYDGVCSNPGGIAGIMTAADQANGIGSVFCITSLAGDEWAVEAQLVSDPNTFYCADSEGAATTTTASSNLDTSNAFCDGV
jgi:prepilin-type N-terminal cleavage/methylation domain-containing protein